MPTADQQQDEEPAAGLRGSEGALEAEASARQDRPTDRDGGAFTCADSSSSFAVASPPHLRPHHLSTHISPVYRARRPSDECGSGAHSATLREPAPRWLTAPPATQHPLLPQPPSQPQLVPEVQQQAPDAQLLLTFHQWQALASAASQPHASPPSAAAASAAAAWASGVQQRRSIDNSSLSAGSSSAAHPQAHDEAPPQPQQSGGLSPPPQAQPQQLPDLLAQALHRFYPPAASASPFAHFGQQAPRLPSSRAASQQQSFLNNSGGRPTAVFPLLAASGGSESSVGSAGSSWGAPFASSPAGDQAHSGPSNATRSSLLLPVVDTVVHTRASADGSANSFCSWPVSFTSGPGQQPQPQQQQQQSRLSSLGEALSSPASSLQPGSPADTSVAASAAAYQGGTRSVYQSPQSSLTRQAAPQPLQASPTAPAPLTASQAAAAAHTTTMQQLQQLQKQLELQQMMISAAIAQAEATSAGGGGSDVSAALPAAVLPSAVTAPATAALTPAVSALANPTVASFLAAAAAATPSTTAASVPLMPLAAGALPAATAEEQLLAAAAAPGALAALTGTPAAALGTPSSFAAAADALAASAISSSLTAAVARQQQQQAAAAVAAAQQASAAAGGGSSLETMSPPPAAVAAPSGRQQLTLSAESDAAAGSLSSLLPQGCSYRSTESHGSDGPSSTGSSRYTGGAGSLQDSGGGALNATVPSLRPATEAAAEAAAAAAAAGSGSGGPTSGGSASGGGASGASTGSPLSVTTANLVIPAVGNQPAQTVAVTVTTTSEGQQSVTLPASALTSIMPTSAQADAQALEPAGPAAASGPPAASPAASVTAAAPIAAASAPLPTLVATPAATVAPPPPAAAAPTTSTLAAVNAAAAALGLPPAATGVVTPSAALVLPTTTAAATSPAAAAAAAAPTPATQAAAVPAGGAVSLEQALLASKMAAAAANLSRQSASSTASSNLGSSPPGPYAWNTSVGSATPSNYSAAPSAASAATAAAAAALADAAVALSNPAAAAGLTSLTPAGLAAAAAAAANPQAYTAALVNAAATLAAASQAPTPTAPSVASLASPVGSVTSNSTAGGGSSAAAAAAAAAAANQAAAARTLQSLQGTLASASLASALLQPTQSSAAAAAATQVAGQAGGGNSGSSGASVWSAPRLTAAGGGLAASQLLSSAATVPAAAMAAAAAAAAAAQAVKDSKVKVLLYAGGAFSRCPSGVWEYCGGETRLISVPRADGLAALAEAVGRSAGLDLSEQNPFVLKYELPGSPELLVDLLCDDDVDNMWEALEEFRGAGADGKPTFKLKLLLQVQSTSPKPGASRTSHSGGAAAGATTASCGAAPTPPSSFGSITPAATPSISNDPSAGGLTASTAALLEHQAGVTLAAGVGAFNTAATAPPGGAPASAGAVQDAATAAAAADLPAQYDTVAANEREAEQALLRSEIGGLLSTDPRVALSELESKLELIRPEDLQILKFLGSGGYGEVYLCRWHSCDVAVKCLNPSLLVPDVAGGSGSSASSDVVTELLKEASMLGGLRHPNIVWVYGIVLPSGVRELKAKRDRLNAAGDIDAVRLTAALAAGVPILPGVIRPPALVAEYLGAGSLRAALSRGADFLRSDVVRVKLALDAARGMEYLHTKRIVHFDLKSGNLLVGFREKSPTCKVADFGLSKQRQQTFVTGVTSLRGTLPWTAPEIIRTPKAVTEKADVYSFGVVLWELWTFREPFDGLNYHALLHQISMSKDPVRPAMPGCPDWDGPAPDEPGPGWIALMTRCWSEDADARPPFPAVVAELEAMLGSVKARRRQTSA